jgi:hypothetical protein
LRTKYLLIIAATSVLLGISILAWPVLTQEGNPIPVFIAILKVELNIAELEPISNTEYLQKSGSYEPLNRMLVSHGWQFVEQFGAGHLYVRNGAKLFVMSRMFTSRYFVYELEMPLN